LLVSEVEDTIPIDALSSLSWKLKYTDTDQAMKYTEEALELSEEGRHLKVMARVHNYIASIFKISNQSDKSIKHTEASIKITHEIKDYIRVSNSNHSLALVYRAKGNAEKAIHFYKNASTYATKAKAFDLITSIQNNTGNSFLALSTL
jgi:tetratricopeptide (TPR) repeat protein